MTDKVQKIRKEVEKLHGNPYYMMAVKDALAIIDSLQEEPSEIKSKCMYTNDNYTDEDRKILCDGCEEECRFNKKKDSVNDKLGGINNALVQDRLITSKPIGVPADAIELVSIPDKKEPVSDDLEKIVEEIAEPTILNAYGTKELARRLRNTTCGTSVSEDLGEYINELSKQFPEVSFAKLSRIAVRVAKWQKQQFEKNRLKHCDSITNEQAELEQKFLDQHLDKHQRMPTFLDAIEYGMRLKGKEMQSTIELAEDHAMLAGMEKMKEQMMAKAIDATVTDIRTYKEENEIDFTIMLEKGIVPYELEDELKVIVIKED